MFLNMFYHLEQFEYLRNIYDAKVKHIITMQKTI
jgi:hypothetical protein